MSTFETLPVVLISAANEDVATKFISEMIDNDVTSEYKTEISSRDRVWRLVNKYYTADVRVHPLIDGEPLLIAPQLVEAHVVHITEEESASESSAVEAARARSAGAAARCWARAHVRLLAAHAAREPPALCAWAGAARAEPVPLRTALPRLRDALHAHPWRGLRRLPPPGPARRDEDGSDSDSWGSWQEAEGEEAEEVDVERFAAALGAARAARGAALRGDADAERRARAESVLRAFCGAIGRDLDRC